MLVIDSYNVNYTSPCREIARVGCALCPVTKKLWKLKQKLNPTLIIWTCIYIFIYIKFECCDITETSLFEIFFSIFSPGLIHFVCVCACACECVCVCVCVCMCVENPLPELTLE